MDTDTKEILAALTRIQDGQLETQRSALAFFAKSIEETKTGITLSVPGPRLRQILERRVNALSDAITACEIAERAFTAKPRHAPWAGSQAMDGDEQPIMANPFSARLVKLRDQHAGFSISMELLDTTKPYRLNLIDIVDLLRTDDGYPAPMY